MSAATLLSADPSAATASPAAEPASTTVSAVAQQQQTAETKTWIDQISDPDTKTYAQAKNFKEPGEVVGLYKNLEKLLGGEKIPMPKGEGDVEGWNRFFKAAGRPETPDGYKLPAPAGGETGFVKDAAQWFHEEGLSVKQANGIAKRYSEYGAKIAAAQQASVDARNAKELEDFKREQGTQFDAKVEMGKRAAKQFGFTNEELVAFQNTFGTKALLTRFATIGQGMGEHVLAGEGKTEFGLSATAAKAQLDMLKKDKEFTAQYLQGNKDAMLRMQTLTAASVGMSLDEYQKSLTGGLQR